MAIITISRQIGSFGDEIAKATADALGYQYIEKVQISEILSKCGFSISDIDKLDEKKPSVWQTLSMQTEIFSNFIRAAINELAARKNVVIVGRGAQVILKDISGVLHVRVIAPFETRVARLIEQRGYEEKDAQRIVRQTDRDSAGYLSNYFESNINDSSLYDLVINTRAMTLEESVELISCAVGAERIQESPQTSEALYDLALNYKAKAALLEVTDKVEWVDLELEKGIALLSGLVSSAAIKNQCERVVLNIHGINSVQNQLNVRDEKTTIY